MLDRGAKYRVRFSPSASDNAAVTSYMAVAIFASQRGKYFSCLWLWASDGLPARVLRLIRAYISSRPENKNGRMISHCVFGEASHQESELILVFSSRRDVLTVVRRLRSVNSVPSAMKTHEGCDYKCASSSHNAARALVPQHRSDFQQTLIGTYKKTAYRNTACIAAVDPL